MIYILISILFVLSFGIKSNRGQNYPFASSICSNSACNCSTIADKKIIVRCNFSNFDEFNIDANCLPSELYELEILDGKTVSLDSRSFSKLQFVQKIFVRYVRDFTIRTGAFVNLGTVHLKLEITKCYRVTIQSRSFFLLRGPVSLTVSTCTYLTVNSQALYWIQTVILREILDVTLEENAFSQSKENISRSRQGYSAKIIMEKVSITELPENTFPSPAAEIKLLESNIKQVKRNAFSAVELYSVLIENTTVTSIGSGAFSDRSLLQNLQLTNVNIHRICTGAILSAVNNFTILNSNVDIVETEGFNMDTTVNVYILNNVFWYIAKNGITLEVWNKAVIENNTLRNLSEEAINVPYNERTRYQNEFYFVSNILENLRDNSIKLHLNEHATTFVISDNILIKPCRCDLYTWISKYVDSTLKMLIDMLYNDSYCMVNAVFAKCFRNTQGFMKVYNFTEHVCNAKETITCTDTNGDGGDGTVPADLQNANIAKAVGIIRDTVVDNKNERRVINAILWVALGGVIIMIILTFFLWLSRNNKFRFDCSCSPFGNILYSLFSRLTISNNLARATSAHSITRVSVHEYAEVWPHKLFDCEMDKCAYECEDKATQTLPEELTQELLQTLREKLSDPENYEEARNMIEHLYDLIKVEECCNNNTLSDQYLVDNNLKAKDDGGNRSDEYNNVKDVENVYDVIKPDSSRYKIQRCDRSFKSLHNKGTRVPSLDKLSPLTFTSYSFANSVKKSTPVQQPPVTDYAEPLDQCSYTYAELYYDGCDPSYASLNFKSDKPLLLDEYKEPYDYQIPLYAELLDIVDKATLPDQRRLNLNSPPFQNSS